MSGWLDEQIEQARDSIRRAGGDHVFHASAVARYVALCQVRQQLAGEVHDERCCMTGVRPGSGPHPDCPGATPRERGVTGG